MAAVCTCRFFRSYHCVCFSFSLCFFPGHGGIFRPREARGTVQACRLGRKWYIGLLRVHVPTLSLERQGTTKMAKVCALHYFIVCPICECQISQSRIATHRNKCAKERHLLAGRGAAQGSYAHFFLHPTNAAVVTKAFTVMERAMVHCILNEIASRIRFRIFAFLIVYRRVYWQTNRQI